MTPSSTSPVIVGLFDNKRDAERAVDELRRAGYSDDQIGVAARDADVQEDVRKGTSDNKGTSAGEAAAIGAAGGAGVGLLWGLGVIGGVLPAIGPVIAGGALAAVLASAATGAAAAGIAGALIGWGVSEEEAKGYEREVNAGRILISVRAAGQPAQAADILRRCNGSTAVR
jgi:hypothetical protein